MISLTLIVLAAVLAWVSLWFTAALWLEDASIADTAWGLGGGIFVPLVAWATTGHLGPRSGVVIAIAAVWGMRLAWHLERRRRASGGDRRYREMLEPFGDQWRRHMYSRVFLTQGVVLVVVTLPLLATMADARRDRIDVWLVIGALLAVAGLLLESIADRQLAGYLKQPKQTRPAVLQTGTWAWCRHPNYLGDATMWWGIGLAVVPTHWGLIALIGPAVINYTLRFGTGVPTVEEHRRQLPEFQAYMKTTPAMLPLGWFGRRRVKPG